MENKNMEMARRVADAVRQAGGRTYYVGGFVRDRLLGLENKDIDIEVHGISVQTLEQILDTLGERLTIGMSFGIMGLRHYDLDIAMPRSEVATGRGHRNFSVCVDPFLGEEKAALRRDFTMNAMMQDVLSGEVLDFFGGREDIACRRIRHVNDSSFAEDPLRVFRAAQFAARFGFEVAEQTAALAAGMEVAALPGERVMSELEKALLKSERPSVFFAQLRRMRQLSVWFPEPEALIGVPQPPRYHPEGDAWAHTLQVLDEAARLRAQAKAPLRFLLSALCHDFGKALVTDAAGHAYAHETEGLAAVQTFLGRLTKETKLHEYVLNMTALHMRPNKLVSEGATVKAYMKLFDRAVCPEDLLLLARADHLGRCGSETDRARLEAAYAQTELQLRQMLAEYRRRMRQPYVMGRDLIEAGMTPGPAFHEALACAHRLRLAGASKEEQLAQALGQLRSEQQTD